MSDLELSKLCRETSAVLNLGDCDAMAQGDVFDVDGVAVELYLGEGMPAPVLIAEIGRVEPADQAGVFRNVLQIQLMTAQAAPLRFGYHPVRESLVITQILKFGTAVTAEALAEVIRVTCRQATEWRTTLLLGKVSDPFGLIAPQKVAADAAAVRA